MTNPDDAPSRAPSGKNVPRRRRAAYTMIEILVVIAIITILVGLVAPALSRARAQSKSTLCTTRLRTLGQGLAIYANEYGDVLVPGRMPKVDDENWRVDIEGGLKYRPTFLAMMGTQVGIAPFNDPQPTKLTIDREGEKGDRQNYASEAYLCPEVPNWTDERNGAYGYNYQFLGNSRLYDREEITSFKNWPVLFSSVRAPGRTVAVGDCVGTAAAFKPQQRGGYDNNARTVNAFGNEGFNLDPPWVDPEHGEVAYSMEEIEDDDGGVPGLGSNGSDEGEDVPARSAVDTRHLKRANILWIDGHCSGENLESLGYVVEEGGIVGLEGNNRLWSTDQRNRVWTKPRSMWEP